MFIVKKTNKEGVKEPKEEEKEEKVKKGSPYGKKGLTSKVPNSLSDSKLKEKLV
jgi:hypothetical protein